MNAPGNIKYIHASLALMAIRVFRKNGGLKILSAKWSKKPQSGETLQMSTRIRMVARLRG